MTPNARIAAAIAVLDQILAGMPAEQALLRWSRGARYAGSGDRGAVRDLVFDSLRRRRSRALLGGEMTGRGLMLGMCVEEGVDPAQIFTGQGHDPAALDPAVMVTPDDAALPHDIPDWIFDGIRAALGPDADAVAEAMRDRAPVWLRVNPLRGTPAMAVSALRDDGILVDPHPGLPTALLLREGERKIAVSRAYKDGLVELQDLSPQIACHMLPLDGHMRVLDYCAGGGGKALALAGRGVRGIVAHDANPDRLRDLPARAARAGADIRIAGRPTGSFDLVIADVPCSGSGTWRRTPDAKWRLTPADLDRLVALQAEILDKAAGHVAPGGRLAYMTCSLLPQENQAQIDAFIARDGRFSCESTLLLTPLTASDGFFVGVLRRDDSRPGQNGGSLTGC